MLQRIGGSFGTSILTVILAYRLATGPSTEAGAAGAIGYTH